LKLTALSNTEATFALMPTLTKHHKEFQELEILQINTKFIIKTKNIRESKKLFCKKPTSYQYNTERT
jgi:hypothetical protein